jgi:putative FmdB family regulatory protein
MPVLVDYRCTGCRGRFEHWAERPVPESSSCPACRAPARRLFGGTLLGRRTGQDGPPPVDVACLRNSDVPGICHMGPSASRRWAAMARKDQRAVESEIAYQESAITAGTLTPSDAFTHAHTPSGPTEPGSQEPSTDRRTS